MVITVNKKNLTVTVGNQTEKFETPTQVKLYVNRAYVKFVQGGHKVTVRTV